VEIRHQEVAMGWRGDGHRGMMETAVIGEGRPFQSGEGTQEERKRRMRGGKPAKMNV